MRRGAKHAGDAVVGTVKPLGDPGKAISRVRSEAADTLDRFERKGAQTRSQAQRRFERLGRQTKQQAKEKSPA